MGRWTCACCYPCWLRYHGGNGDPHRINEEFRESDICGHCGEETQSGIYIRLDPKDQHPNVVNKR